MIVRIRPFLEDPDDEESEVYNGLSEKATLKLKVICSIGVGSVIFLVMITILAILMVEIRDPDDP